MRPDPQDRLTQDTRPAGGSRTLLIAGLIGIAVLTLWFFTRTESELPAPPAQATSPAMPLAEPELALPAAPDIPQAAAAAPAPAPVVQAEQPAPVSPVEPTISLESSDEELRASLAGASNSQLLKNSLALDDLIERGAASVDTLSRGALFSKLLPLVPPKGRFTVVEIGDQLTIDPASYERYEAHVQMIESLDVATLVKTFHRFRPLLEKTYANMGYRGEDFDNAVIRALDRILAVPQIDGPIPVVKSEAIYKFSDPSLERRSALEKQLVRMGPENVTRVQRQARDLRAALLESP